MCVCVHVIKWWASVSLWNRSLDQWLVRTLALCSQFSVATRSLHWLHFESKLHITPYSHNNLEEPLVVWYGLLLIYMGHTWEIYGKCGDWTYNNLWHPIRTYNLQLLFQRSQVARVALLSFSTWGAVSARRMRSRIRSPRRWFSQASQRRLRPNRKHLLQLAALEKCIMMIHDDSWCIWLMLHQTSSRYLQYS